MIDTCGSKQYKRLHVNIGYKGLLLLIVMLQNIISASYMNSTPGRRYSPNNHCEYIEMAVAPSAYEAHATRTFIIEDGMQNDNDMSDMQGVRHAPTPVTPSHAPPSISALLGIGGFGFTGPHPAHMMYMANKQSGGSALGNSQDSHAHHATQISPEIRQPNDRRVDADENGSLVVGDMV